MPFWLSGQALPNKDECASVDELCMEIRREKWGIPEHKQQEGGRKTAHKTEARKENTNRNEEKAFY